MWRFGWRRRLGRLSVLGRLGVLGFRLRPLGDLVDLTVRRDSRGARRDRRGRLRFRGRRRARLAAGDSLRLTSGPLGWGADRARHERLRLLVAGVAREHLGQLPDRLGAPVRLQQQLRQMYAQREIVRCRLDGSGQ
jgi:hypothetical protein